MSVLVKRRGISCTSSRSRTGKDRCVRLLRRPSPVSALPPVPGRSDTANLFAGAAGGVRSPAPPQANAAARRLAPQHWPRRHRRADEAAVVETELVARSLKAAARPVALECEKGSAPFHCQYASSCPQKGGTLPS